MSNMGYLYENFQLEEYMLDFLRSVLSTEWDGDKKEIVFFGDSIIRDYDLSRFFSDVKSTLFNCGVSGITTHGLFNIVKQGVVRHNPKAVVILVGTNDMSEYYNKRDQEIISNLAQIITELKLVLKNVRIVLISILPCDEDRYGKYAIPGCGRENSRIKKVNTILKEFQNIFNGLTFIDAFTPLSDVSGNLINAYTHDGIHLTLKGYEKLTAILKPVIQEILKKD